MRDAAADLPELKTVALLTSCTERIDWFSFENKWRRSGGVHAIARRFYELGITLLDEVGVRWTDEWFNGW